MLGNLTEQTVALLTSIIASGGILDLNDLNEAARLLVELKTTASTFMVEGVESCSLRNVNNVTRTTLGQN